MLSLTAISLLFMVRTASAVTCPFAGVTQPVPLFNDTPVSNTFNLLADVTGIPDTGDTAPVSDHAELKALDDKLQAVCNDPANQWIKNLKYVARIIPAADCNPQDSNDCWPAISVQVDLESHIDEVKRRYHQHWADTRPRLERIL